jgi:AraC-like DNA-binding protein
LSSTELVTGNPKFVARDAPRRQPGIGDDRRRDAVSITEIAFERGFSHPAHFSRAFRARFGMAPSDWRSLSQRSA